MPTEIPPAPARIETTGEGPSDPRRPTPGAAGRTGDSRSRLATSSAGPNVVSVILVSHRERGSAHVGQVVRWEFTARSCEAILRAVYPRRTGPEAAMDFP